MGLCSSGVLGLGGKGGLASIIRLYEFGRAVRRSFSFVSVTVGTRAIRMIWGADYWQRLSASEGLGRLSSSPNWGFRTFRVLSCGVPVVRVTVRWKPQLKISQQLEFGQVASGSVS